MNRSIVALISTAAAVALTLGGAVAAEASPSSTHHSTVSPNYGVLPVYTYSAINVTTASGYTDKSQVLGQCYAANRPQTCTITAGRTSSQTIGLDLGATYGIMSGIFHWSSNPTQTINVSCAGYIQIGQTWEGWPYGVHKHYQIKKTETVSGIPTGSTWTSAYHNAFSAYTSSISCGLA